MTATSEQLTDTRLRDAVWAALARVVDPELDQPITDLGFVRLCEVRGGDVGVRLRLPTAFCAPNFAYLMTADAYEAVAGLPGVESVDVRLEDHHDAEQINAGVAAQAGFADTYATEANAELDELRRTFRRKAHTACLERACRRLLADGWQIEGLADLSLGDVPASPEQSGLLRRRADLGLSTSPDSLLLVDDEGNPVPAEQVSLRLRFAQAVRVSIDGNAHFCRGLLATRYRETEHPGEEDTP
ncbi:iron-sulfur cluster assembly protein [Sciscionella marina]|uniref:iron-sulfur cluster assembly protein n=1 Tax=Sciscionella marina TaxID=508770 RepID=UPI000363FAE0|nr:iron-sulfur cluster assembly protein [Sciscionella marina]